MKKLNQFHDESEITPQSIFLERRKLIKNIALMSAFSPYLLSAKPFKPSNNFELFKNEDLTPFNLATQYNNYYEFSDNKKMVHHLSRNLNTENWSIEVDGLVEKKLTLSINDINKIKTEKRIYSLRCVEGWSMVVPWQGFELNELLNKAMPLKSARYVQFEAHFEPEVMVGQRRNTLDWPYTEGLRLDEALHPLTILATGMYDQALPKQNGGPIRLVVPWKYGYKSIKAIRKIILTDKKPDTTWVKESPSVYGFYGNVNPNIPHPRWNQRKELRLGELKKRRTQLLNGYSEYLTDLYSKNEINHLF